MADIVLKDRNGNPVEYPGVEKIKVNTVDGEAVEFVDSATIPEVLENLPIVLDFSGGNQTVTAPAGQMVKSAIIQRPANLTPENIAKDIDVAGIVGTFAGGGEKESKAIDFYDIFGNRIYSYTMAEALALTELPPGPELEGYDFETWTYTLDDIHKYPVGLSIGPRYTKNGLYAAIVVVNAEAGVEMPLNFYCMYDSCNVTIDWGDGEQISEALTVNTTYTVVHTYDSNGVKVIGLTHDQQYRSRFCVGKYYTSAGVRHRTYVAVGDGSYRYMRWLVSISGCNIHQSALYCDSELVYLDVGVSGSSSNSASGRMCGKLKVYAYSPITSVGVNDVPAYTFNDCHALKRYAGMPGSIQALYLDEYTSFIFAPSAPVNARRIIMHATSLRTISISFNTALLESIYITDSWVDKYKTASGWSTYASYIKPLSEYPY